MIFRNQGYILTWLAVIISILALTALAILGLRGSNGSAVLIALSLSGWLLGVSAGVYLFLKVPVPTQDKKDVSEPGSDDQAHDKMLKSSSKGDKHKLDIQGTAKKIVRRIDTGSSPSEWAEQLLKQFVDELEIMSGVIYLKEKNGKFLASATYSYPHTNEPAGFEIGEGLTGQVVRNKQLSLYTELPDEYFEVFSGLGSGKPSYLAIVPVAKKGEIIAVIEVAGYRYADENLGQLFLIVERELDSKLNEPNEKENTGSDPKNDKDSAGEKSGDG